MTLSLRAILLSSAALCLFATPAHARSLIVTNPHPIAVEVVKAPGKGEIAWGLDKSDLIPDPDIRYGVLPNGMRYAIRRNVTPPGFAVIRMRIDAGSTAEADDQRGLAHFLEHMAFNGSAKVPEGEMVKILERHGLAFGADTNASTGFDETVYKLDLPRTDQEMLDTGMMLMREIASELKLNPAAIDRERGIILSEKRARDQFGLRRLEHLIHFALPGTKVADRLPIGTDDVIKNAPAKRLADLYHHYYTPERTTLIIVGDIDPAMIEAKIRTDFANWKPKNKPGANPELGMVDPNRPIGAAWFSDPHVPTSVSILEIKPRDKKPDTIANRERDLQQSLAEAMLNRRLARLSRETSAKFLGAAVSSDTFFDTAELASVSIGAKDSDWQSALNIGEQELRRALQFGFTQAELNEQLATMRNEYENAAKQAETRRTEALAETLVSAAKGDAVITTPAYRLELLNRFEKNLNIDKINAVFRATWAGANPLIHVSGKTPPANPERVILEAYAASRAVAVTANVDKGAAAFAYTNFGTPGTVAVDTRVADLDIRTVTFANNVRLNIKKTAFQKDKVSVTLLVGSGALEFPKDKPGLAMFMNSAFSAGGTVAHSVDELQTIMAGRSVRSGFVAGSDGFGSSVTTTPEDLELQLQIWAAYVTAPGFRAEGDAQWQGALPNLYNSITASPAGVAGRDVPRIIANGDPRFGLPSLAELQRRNMAELKIATANAFAKEAIEIGIVGDVDEKMAIDIVARTFGALPKREPDFQPFTDARQVKFPDERKPITLYHDGKADEALLQLFWPTTDDKDTKTDIQLSLLAGVMRLMLTEELREALGATYSPSASSRTSSIYPGYGQIIVSSNLSPADIAKAKSAIMAIAAKLREAPISDDLILRARKPILESIEKSRRDNPGWMGIVSDAQSKPEKLERFRNISAIYGAVTGAELQALAKRYLDPKVALEIRIVKTP